MSDATADRVVVVTGAGTGVGRAIARRVLRDGYRCVVAGPIRDQLEETVALSNVDPLRAVAVVADVRAPDDRKRLVELATAQPGALYAVVNNAGITRRAPLFDESLADWRDTMETNLESSYFLARDAVEVMRDRREGRIVNIASVRGLIGLNNRVSDALLPEATPSDRGPMRVSAYAASKGGLIQLTKDLASAVGRWGITVNAVSPGTVQHPREEEQRLTAASPTDTDSLATMRQGIIANVPLGRLACVDDVAGPVSFLLSSDAAYVTGINMVVDGGWTIWA